MTVSLLQTGIHRAPLVSRPATRDSLYRAFTWAVGRRILAGFLQEKHSQGPGDIARDETMSRGRSPDKMMEPVGPAVQRRRDHRP